MKIKVLQICGQLSIGGQEMMAKNFFKYINRDKFVFDYIVYGNEIGEYEKEVISLGAKVYHLSFPSLSNIRKYRRELEKIIKDGNYQVVHSHTYTNNGIVLKLANKYDIPVRISHCHSTESGKKENIIYKLYKLYMKSLIIKNATHLIACGKKAGDSFYGKKIFSSKGIILKNGIDTTKFSYNKEISNIIKEKYLLDDCLILGHIGRFVDVKNHKYLIDIIASLKEELKNFKLLLIGDGELYFDIYKYAEEKNVLDKIIFLGNQNNVNEFLQAIDVVLCPSKYEGLPVSLIEAQTSGAKCIVSKNVSPEVKISDNVVFLDITNSSIPSWCNEIKKKSSKDRKLYCELIKKNGYDIKDTCLRLEEIYCYKDSK